MVRRGVKPGESTDGSVKIGKNKSRLRPSSANDGDANKSTDVVSSTKSSPALKNNDLSSESSPAISTTSSSKKTVQSNVSRSQRAINWRLRGICLNPVDMSDPRFSITNEDFPALPGAGGGTKKSNGMKTSAKKKREEESSNESSPRPTSVNSMDERVSTDDSGVSSLSRGNTPPQENSSEIEMVKKTEKKKLAASAESSPRKPLKSLNSTPRKKGNNNANSTNNASPLSFLKLSKSGQKVPERRGRLNSRINGSPQKLTDTPETKVDDTPTEKEVDEEPVFDSGNDAVPERKDCPRIQLGEDGEMTNIPPSMLDDQFGLAAMLPILNLMKNRNNPTNSEQQSATPEQDRMIEMLACGVEMNSLGVPTKNDQKPVWNTFAGPFGSDPLPPVCMGVAYNELPSVYYTARTLQGTIDMSKTMPEKVGLHELFYIFYNFPQEFWQLNTARELQTRGWRFCISEKLWVHRKLNTDEFGINSLGQSISAIFRLPATEIVTGLFEVYDPEKMRIITREMHLKSSDMEPAGWELEKEDKMYTALSSVLPADYIWGPQRNSENSAKAAANVKPSFNRAPAPPVRGKPNRRILSFVEPDAPEPSSSKNEEYQRQMYSTFMQQFTSRYPTSAGTTQNVSKPRQFSTNPSLFRQSSQSTSYYPHLQQS
ncbi:unnamed protein product [Caenorhabditis angaria]|uniref:NOT2/NOT3/NOT5 C-terminal domain-containing protein n=1 Tax=Caenorhabditis angaria TaxID=860376 RepID=A0A9P1IXH6_9PELO|nr:unnamed protein product [Caenorhabditis angaria]